MLEIITHPPTKSIDVELSALSLEGIKDNPDDEKHRTDLGNHVGQILMSNVADQDFGVVMNIARDLAKSTNGLNDFNNIVPFLQGVVVGAINEAEARSDS